MQVLVTYDVCTVTRKGRRRLRRVAQVCQDFGQRVQKSVFECVVGETEFAKLRERLLATIDPAQDSLRLYRLPGKQLRGNKLPVWYWSISEFGEYCDACRMHT